MSILCDTPCFSLNNSKNWQDFSLIQAKQIPSSNLNPEKMGFSGEVFQWSSKLETKMSIKMKGQSELSALPKFKQIYMFKNESIQISLLHVSPIDSFI